MQILKPLNNWCFYPLVMKISEEQKKSLFLIKSCDQMFINKMKLQKMTK
jgi:hypothetical protein